MLAYLAVTTLFATQRNLLPLENAVEGTVEAVEIMEELTLLSDRFPKLAAVIAKARTDPETLAEEIRTSPIAAIANEVALPPARAAGNSTLPVVIAHGMGDSCFNAGMKSITAAAGSHLGVYSTCIPTGKNRITDTINGFLLSMDKSIDVFAEKIRADPKLAGGFDAFGLSQGNNLIRGYISKYNNPPVRNFMSICGINAGVGAFPECSPGFPIVGTVCQVLAEVLGDFAYLELIQNHLFQADYFRDPKKVGGRLYKRNSQLAQLNGEGNTDVATYKANWAKTSKFVWVKGDKDTVVWPREGEWWGAADPEHPWKKVLHMNETDWYLKDSFGLRAAEEAGKNFFESFDGNHIRFKDEELFGWLAKYFN